MRQIRRGSKVYSLPHFWNNPCTRHINMYIHPEFCLFHPFLLWTRLGLIDWDYEKNSVVLEDKFAYFFVSMKTCLQSKLVYFLHTFLLASVFAVKSPMQLLLKLWDPLSAFLMVNSLHFFLQCTWIFKSNLFISPRFDFLYPYLL